MIIIECNHYSYKGLSQVQMQYLGGSKPLWKIRKGFSKEVTSVQGFEG